MLSTDIKGTALAVGVGAAALSGIIGFVAGRRLFRTTNTSFKAGATGNPIISYCADNSLRLHPMQKKLIQLTKNHPGAGMLGSADQIQFLQNLAKTIKAKKTLDIGVYTGYSSLSMAMALPEDGKVVACDITDEYPSIGKPVWKEAGVSHKIDLRIGPASESLQQLIDNGESGTFDLAFIDADKQGYENYYEKCLLLLKQRGVIVFDNMLWGGSVVNPKDDVSITLNALSKKLHKDTRVDVSLLMLGDGTYMAFKR